MDSLNLLSILMNWTFKYKMGTVKKKKWRLDLPKSKESNLVLRAIKAGLSKG